MKVSLNILGNFDRWKMLGYISKLTFIECGYFLTFFRLARVGLFGQYAESQWGLASFSVAAELPCICAFASTNSVIGKWFRISYKVCPLWYAHFGIHLLVLHLTSAKLVQCLFRFTVRSKFSPHTLKALLSPPGADLISDLPKGA